MKNHTIATTTPIEIGNKNDPAIYVKPSNEKIIREALNIFLAKMFDTPCLYYYVRLNDVPCVLESIRLLGAGIWANIRYPNALDVWERDEFLSYLNKGRLYLEGDLEYDETVAVDPNNFTFTPQQMNTLCRSDQLSSINFYRLSIVDKTGDIRQTIYRIPVEE